MGFGVWGLGFGGLGVSGDLEFQGFGAWVFWGFGFWDQGCYIVLVEAGSYVRSLLFQNLNPKP